MSKQFSYLLGKNVETRQFHDLNKTDKKRALELAETFLDRVDKAWTLFEKSMHKMGLMDEEIDWCKEHQESLRLGLSPYDPKKKSEIS